MSVPELRKYVLEHRDDMEAMRSLFHHPRLSPCLWELFNTIESAFNFGNKCVSHVAADIVIVSNSII
ncbi:DUF6887 family protein [[Scytonema hofmanni] UTEX B 1581]